MSSFTVHTSARAAFNVRRPVGTPAHPGPAVRSRLRVTRRGRLALVALASAPLLAAALWFGVSTGAASAQAPSAATAHGSVEHVTVAQGESLWQIAERVAPHADPREVIDAIVDMNGLQSTVVTPGESLAIPAQYAR
ncbi:LysM peptidoglycan-binding domain-containing protein [Gryllotalpicola daejeonensis]